MQSTGKNPIGTADLEGIFARNCELLDSYVVFTEVYFKSGIIEWKYARKYGKEGVLR